jgi:hypothetical protein
VRLFDLWSLFARPTGTAKCSGEVEANGDGEDAEADTLGSGIAEVDEYAPLKSDSAEAEDRLPIDVATVHGHLAYRWNKADPGCCFSIGPDCHPVKSRTYDVGVRDDLLD